MLRKISILGPVVIVVAVLLSLIAYVPKTVASGPHTLEIIVVGEGTTLPPPGIHSYDEGQVVTVRAEPAEGYVFYQWEIDGKRVGRNSPIIRIEMSEDHLLRALFVKETLVAPLKSVSSSEGDEKGAGSMAGGAEWRFPMDYRLVAGEIDLSLNGDLIGDLKGNGSRVLYLGGPMAIPFPWGNYNVSFQECSLVVADDRFNAVFGKRDYAVILIKDDGDIRIAGITRYGTRAGLIWLLKEYEFLVGKDLIILEWIDLNDNGEVEYWEISPIVEW